MLRKFRPMMFQCACLATSESSIRSTKAPWSAGPTTFLAVLDRGLLTVLTYAGSFV